MSTKAALVLMPVIFLIGCATPPSPDVLAAANREVRCVEGADCNAKWSRAVAWVARNSRWKIQTQTDQLIQTYGPGETDSTANAWTITKAAEGNGIYRIDARGGCANIFACIPETLFQKGFLLSEIGGGTAPRIDLQGIIDTPAPPAP